MRSPRILPNFRATPPGITARLTRPAAWRPMTDEEWEAIMHLMIYAHPPGRGRYTIMGVRRSLDACFHAACMDKPWRALPEHYGKHDTIARLFRRWAHCGVWREMLKFVARERPGLEAVQYWVCRAFRRSWRIEGLAGLTLARRLGMDSALRAASWLLPDSQLSCYLRKVLIPRLAGDMREYRAHTSILMRLHTLCMGRRSLPRHLQLSVQEREAPEYFIGDWAPGGTWRRQALAA